MNVDRLGDLKKVWLPAALYFSANALFVYKYGARTPLGSYSALLLYAGLFAAALPVYLNFIGSRIDKLKPARFAAVYWGMFGFFAVAALVILFKTDPMSVGVDRWSALDGFISHLFAGKYPYLATSHLGNQVAPMPVMNFISIPPYLMGDVGYLQIIVFAAAAAVVFCSGAAKSGKTLFMLAFLAAPAFWYEVAARSDLVSNITLMCLGLLLIEKITNGDPLKRPVKTGCISGLLFCTRGVFIIPFTVFFFARSVSALKAANIRQCLLFAGSAAAVFAATLLPFVLWNLEAFEHNGPLAVQTNKTPTAVQFSAIALAALLSFNARSIGALFSRTAICMFALMSATLIFRILTVGWNTAIFSHRFDITYYSTIIPFIIFGTLFGRNSTKETDFTTWEVGRGLSSSAGG